VRGVHRKETQADGLETWEGETMSEDWGAYDDDYDEMEYDDLDEATCSKCSHTTAGEECCGCGNPLCPMCFETGGGLCGCGMVPDEDDQGEKLMPRQTVRRAEKVAIELIRNVILDTVIPPDRVAYTPDGSIMIGHEAASDLTDEIMSWITGDDMRGAFHFLTDDDDDPSPSRDEQVADLAKELLLKSGIGGLEQSAKAAVRAARALYDELDRGEGDACQEVE